MQQEITNSGIDLPMWVREKAIRESIYPVSRNTIWRLVREGKFPKPVKVEGATLWRRDQVLAWMERHAEQGGAA